jgi:hypothetical protein
MPATVEQVTADPAISSAFEQATLPTTTYNPVDHAVEVTVIVSRLESNSLKFTAPPIVLKRPKTGDPTSVWTLTWQFQPDSSLAGIVLDTFSIQVPAKGTTMPFTPTPTGLSEWIIPINSIDDPSLIAFEYDILASNGFAHLVDDPTIVVTPEPIGG